MLRWSRENYQSETSVSQVVGRLGRVFSEVSSNFIICWTNWMQAFDTCSDLSCLEFVWIYKNLYEFLSNYHTNFSKE